MSVVLIEIVFVAVLMLVAVALTCATGTFNGLVDFVDIFF